METQILVKFLNSKARKIIRMVQVELTEYLQRKDNSIE